MVHDLGYLLREENGLAPLSQALSQSYSHSLLVHELTSSILKEARLAQVPHMLQIIGCQTAIGTQIDLFEDKRDDFLVDGGLVKGPKGGSLPICSNQIVHLLEDVAVLALSTRMRTQSEEDSLHQVIIVICLSLINHIGTLLLDPGVLLKGLYCFSYE